MDLRALLHCIECLVQQEIDVTYLCRKYEIFPTQESLHHIAEILVLFVLGLLLL
jgi:hypothetical protein